MEAFRSALYELLLRDGKLDPAAVPLFMLVFGVGCAAAALLVLILDICVFVVRRWSFLRYDHGIVRSVVAGVLMPSAAGIVGMIGLAIDVLQPSRAACIAVGIAWPSLMTVLMGVQEDSVQERIPDDSEEDADPEPDEEVVE